ncbi:MAG: TRAP transporter substrate-binding protein [SAR324 cluster bacterium]|nr:TRAP transporter substrate-binding protein [SAR324 cluster bacterium]
MPPVHIKFGGYQPPSSVHNQAAEVFGQELSMRLGKAVQFELDGNIMNSGHKAADLFQLVESGELTACYFSTSYLSTRIPEFALFDLPFVIDQREKAYALMDGPLGETLSEKVNHNTAYRLLGLWDNGFRHWSNKVRPIRKPEDCRGMRLRTLFSDLHTEAFKLLGFDPIPLDVKDLISHVNSGEIDAQENPLTNLYNFGIHHHHRYLTLSCHFFGAAAFLCHQPSYQSWPSEFRQAFDESADAATAKQRQLAAAEDDDVMNKLISEDVEIVELTKNDRGEFKRILIPLVEAQRKRFGDSLFRHLS